MRPVSVWVTGADQHYMAIRADSRGEDDTLINPYTSAYFAYVNLMLTSSFGRAHRCSPLTYRAAYPPATDQVRIPTCMLLAYGRPSRAVLEKTPG